MTVAEAASLHFRVLVSEVTSDGYARNATMSDSQPAPPATDFRIDETEWVHGSRIVIVAVHGDTDMHVADELRVRIEDAIDEAPAALVIDLSGVTFLDSMALGVLLGGLKRVGEVGGQLRVVTSRPEIRRIFEVTMLDQLFDLDPSRAEALAATTSRA